MSDVQRPPPHWNPTHCTGSPHCPPRCPRFIDRDGYPWTIRPATGDDLDALVDMYADFAASQRVQGVPPRKEVRIRPWVEDLLEEGCNHVVEGRDRIVGHALYTPTDDAEPEFAVFVHQDFQDRGIGTEVSKHVVATAAVGDRVALSLIVDPNNRDARRLYDRLGFEMEKELSFERGSNTTDHIRMRLALDGSAARRFVQTPTEDPASPGRTDGAKELPTLDADD